MNFLQNKKAFTLIELLVVITIIAILATGGVNVYTSQIQKARDTTRIQDTSAIRSAVEQYYQDGFEYPSTADNWLSATNGVITYLPGLAQDPKQDQTCNSSRCGYIYEVSDDINGITNGAFELSTAFENNGNKIARASNTSDSGNDDDRLEIGFRLNTINTSQAQTTAFNGTPLTGADLGPFVIGNSQVLTK